MDAELEAELRELIDRRKIWEVLLRYSRGFDRLDRPLLRSCYWADATEDHHAFGGTPDQFIDGAMALHGGWQSIHHHCITNHSCELDGDDAHAESYYLFIGVNNEPPHLLSIGRYIDHFQRREGEWRIANRVCVIERNLQLPDDPRVPIVTDDAILGPVLPASRDRNDLSYQRPIKPRRYPPEGISPVAR